MRKSWIVACAVLFLSAAGYSQTPSAAPLSQEALAAILGQPAAGSCAAQPAEPGRARVPAKPPRRGGLQKAVCTATCESGTVSCESSGDCTAADRNCAAGEIGHVTCGSTTSWCPTDCCLPNESDLCCDCRTFGDCFSCCRCHGGGPTYCRLSC